ncbi:GNAT family N-acetyltransferase [Alloscardovia criceti]|uniref:GNAT family N-acetyltransferase n=1 Tax=Alloscardovia criceti TaxID=356828 RepID=UPI00036DE05B|nr:GNAT family N-acetyltransferase [Alloscardovia criceti]
MRATGLPIIIRRIEALSPELIHGLVDIWETSVRQTHYFLTVDDVETIKTFVPQAIASVQHLVVAQISDELPIAFMGINHRRLEMLFISPAFRGQGIGRTLLEWGIDEYGVDELTVNEQNPSAVGFYEHLGFETYKRAERDEEGQPFPLLYMRR